MNEILPSPPLLTAFLAASLVLAVVPGPGVAYVVLRSVTDGRKAGLASVAGLALGNFGNAVGASLGLAAVLAVSSIAFTVIKWAGALYLVWLGFRTIRRPAATEGPGGPVGRTDVRRVFRDGFVVALLNPKTAMFFAAFLPQFMGAATVPALQGMVLGAIFVAIAAITDTLYALAAGSGAAWLGGVGGISRGGRYLAGGTLIGLGVMTAVSGGRAGR